MDGLFRADWWLCLRDEGMLSQGSMLRVSAQTGIYKGVSSPVLLIRGSGVGRLVPQGRNVEYVPCSF